MSEPWFDPMYAWLPGTVLGCLCGLAGGIGGGLLVPAGKAKGLVVGSMAVLLAASAIMLIAGAAGYFTGQPYGVWYGLGLAGVIGVVVIGANLPVVLRAYRLAEERRIKAQDMA
jgi:hypothetical protein